MSKQEFVRVTIDVVTYGQLTDLAYANKVTRAQYIRQIIQSHSAEAQREQGIAGALPEPTPIGANAMQSVATDEVIMRKHGQFLIVNKSDLDFFEDKVNRLGESKLAKKFGIRAIDLPFARWFYDSFVKGEPVLPTREQEQTKNSET